eukprot:TRINITY_DN16758_c0_g1_i1.p1 TRINITY_DN16758_c0_g1~~TRINITY_DN16758_c0_g1_i1.p1  ORF type:complete len:317 (-),score=37.68 TRINITY_DN16758_c0_g1_i1:75-1025(-)
MKFINYKKPTTNSTTTPIASSFMLLLCGGMTGAFTKTLLSPLERLKILYQTQGLYYTYQDRKYKGIIPAMNTIFKEEGIRGFFKGNGINLVRIIPNSAVKFALFDTYKDFLKKRLPTDPVTNPPMFFLRTLAAAGLSGGTQILVTYPLDVMHTRMSLKSYGGIANCVRNILRTEGVLGFYKGLGPTLLGVVPYVGFSMATYEFLKKCVLPRREDNTIPLPFKLFSGMVGAITAGSITFPTDTIRRRMQVQGSSQFQQKNYKNSVDCAIKIVRNEGLRTLYAGYATHMLKAVPGTAIQLVVYDFIKKLMGLDQLGAS